jgi:hypothetical protein
MFDISDGTDIDDVYVDQRSKRREHIRGLAVSERDCNDAAMAASGYDQLVAVFEHTWRHEVIKVKLSGSDVEFLVIELVALAADNQYTGRAEWGDELPARRRDHAMSTTVEAIDSVRLS